MKKDRWYNPLMRWLLRSRLHGLVSKDILLIGFTGRKTGRAYSTPINYSQHGQLIQLVSHQSRTWWRNLEGGAPVTVWLRGQELSATAGIVSADGDELIQALRDVYHGLTHEQAARLAGDSVIIRLQLTETQGQPVARAAQPAR